MAYHLQPASTSTALSILWQNIENWVWMDIFIWFIGAVSLANVVLLVVMVILAAYQAKDGTICRLYAAV